MAVIAPAFVLPLTTGAALIALGVDGLSAPGLHLDWLDVTLVWLFVFVLVAFTAASQLAIRRRDYRALGRIPPIQMVATLAGQILLGIAGFGRGLFLGAVAGRSLGIIGLARAAGIRRSDWPHRAAATSLARRFWRFPVMFAPAALVNTLGLYAPALMMPALFGLGPAGLWAMAYRLAVAPSAVLTQATGQVFLGEFARTTSPSQAVRVFLRWSALLLCLGVLTSVVIWAAAQTLPWLLGEAWAGTEQLAISAGVMAGAAIIGSPVQAVWTVRQWGLAQFSWNVLRLIASAGVLWWAAENNYSIEGAAQLLAITTCLTYAIGWLGCLWAALEARSPSAARDRDRDR
jgi:hypothetical protein